MICAACGKQNLPGGVRCVYCGTHFPAMPDFALEVGGPAVGAATSPPPPPPRPAARLAWGGLISGGVALAMKWKVIAAVLGSFGPTILSMGVWIAAESFYLGPSLAVGLCLCIFIHELGHVVMAVRHGIKASAPMFIPFLGALITVKEMPADPTVESEIGAGGPVAGAAAAAVCAAIAALTHQPYWTMLAFLGFGINLFNLIPVLFLDGARISTAFSNSNWDFVLVAALLLVLKFPSLPLWGMLVVLFVMRLGRARQGRFQLAPPTTRIRMSLVYLALLVGLCYGVDRFRPSPADRISARRSAASSRASDSHTASDDDGAPAANPSTPAASDGRWRVVGIPLPRLSPERDAQIKPIRRAVLTIFALIIALVCWLVTPFQLAGAARQRIDRRGRLLALSMLGLLAVILASGWSFGFWRTGPVLTAYLAASLAACIFAVYRSGHGPRGGETYAALSWHCLGAAALTALMVAYWLNSLAVLAVLLVCAGIYYGRRPWLLLSLLARLNELLGRLEPALSLRERALALHPEPEAEVTLWQAVALNNLALARGAAALTALDNWVRVLGPAPIRPLAEFASRTAALVCQDRFEEALAQCEALLRVPVSTPLEYRVNLALVRELLGAIALYRGWPDEARAQADMLERELPGELAQLSRRLVGSAHRLRAQAFTEEDRLDEADAACVRSLEWDRNGRSETGVALIRGQIALKRGEKERADRETASAYRRMPGSLETRYWRACALRALGSTEQANALLQDLARDYPGEHWGRRAAAALG